MGTDGLISLTISAVALCISLLTAWMTLLRRGTIKMTQPAVIFFGPDGTRWNRQFGRPKVFLKTLLFSTSQRGRIVESMHIIVRRDNARQMFSVWVYGDRQLTRGSGIFVGQNGVEANHHFLMPDDQSSFEFVEGWYVLDVYAHILGDRESKHLFSQRLEVGREEAKALKTGEAGLYFDWTPESSAYLPHLNKRQPQQEDID
jgi:hypothetical protein